MKWILFALILSLSLNLPLFQTNQAAGVNWLICEDAVVTKSEKDDSSIDPDSWLNLKLSSNFFNRVKSFFKPKSHSSILLSHFQGASLFSRPPPHSHPCLF